MTASRRKCEPCCSPGSKNKKTPESVLCSSRETSLPSAVTVQLWWAFILMVFFGVGHRVAAGQPEHERRVALGFFFDKILMWGEEGRAARSPAAAAWKSALNKVGCQWGPGGDFDRKTQGSCLETQVLWLGGKSVRRPAMFQADGEQVTQRWLWFCDQCFLVLQKLQLLNDNKCFRSQIQHHVRTEVENKSLFC